MKIPFWLTASVVIAIAIAIAAAAPASAGSLNQTSAGYTYFNKPGADPAHYDSDLADCRLFAGTTVQPINRFLSDRQKPIGVTRKLRPDWQAAGGSKWEMLVSATSVQAQVNALDLGSAESLFANTLAVTVAGQDYLIESIGASEALGQVYLYRLLVQEAGVEAV